MRYQHSFLFVILVFFLSTIVACQSSETLQADSSLSFSLPGNDGDSFDPSDPFVFDMCVAAPPHHSVALVELTSVPATTLYCDDPRYRTDYKRLSAKVLGVAVGALPLETTNFIVYWELDPNLLSVGDTVLVSARESEDEWFIDQWIFAELNPPNILSADNKTVDLPSTWSDFQQEAKDTQANFENQCSDFRREYMTMTDQDYDTWQHSPSPNVMDQCDGADTTKGDDPSDPNAETDNNR